MVPAQEDAPEAIMPSAAGVTLELDVVMDHLRNEMGQIQQEGCSDQLIPGLQQQLALHRAWNAGGLNTRQICPNNNTFSRDVAMYPCFTP